MGSFKGAEDTLTVWQIKPADESDEWVWQSWEELRNEDEREIPLPLATILEENPSEKALLRRSL